MTVKALKSLLWHLSREPRSGLNNLKNKQSISYDKQTQTKKKPQRTNKLRGELVFGRTRSDDKGWVYHCANRMFQVKTKFSNDECPSPVYFNAPFLIICLNSIETLICHGTIELIGSASFRFAQNMLHDFRNTVLNSLWHCLRLMPQKGTNASVIIIDQVSLGRDTLSTSLLSEYGTYTCGSGSLEQPGRTTVGKFCVLRLGPKRRKSRIQIRRQIPFSLQPSTNRLHKISIQLKRDVRILTRADDIFYFSFVQVESICRRQKEM